MSRVTAAPDVLASAAGYLERIERTLREARVITQPRITTVLAAADDEVSAAIASLFSRHGLAYQHASARMSALHAQFVETLDHGAIAYASAEAANANPLQALERNVLGLMNAPTNLLLGRPLIGDL